jgi:hypothetical protein
MPADLIAALGGLSTHVAVMSVVKDKYLATGRCELSLDEIAAKAGASRDTAKRALRKAAELNVVSIEHRPVPGRKHLPNLVHIISMEWRAFLLGLRKNRSDINGTETPIGVQRTPSAEEDDRKRGNENSASDRPPPAAPLESGQPSKDAIGFGDELANISGYRPSDMPQAWRNTDLLQNWFDLLTRANVPRPLDALRAMAADVMRRKRKSDPRPPHSPRYFSAEVRKLADRSGLSPIKRVA